MLDKLLVELEDWTANSKRGVIQAEPDTELTLRLMNNWDALNKTNGTLSYIATEYIEAHFDYTWHYMENLLQRVEDNPRGESKDILDAALRVSDIANFDLGLWREISECPDYELYNRKISDFNHKIRVAINYPQFYPELYILQNTFKALRYSEPLKAAKLKQQIEDLLEP